MAKSLPRFYRYPILFRCKFSAKDSVFMHSPDYSRPRGGEPLEQCLHW